MEQICKMGELEKDILKFLESNPGLTDRELAEAIQGHKSSIQYINQNCRGLESQGVIIRKKRDDGLIGNWLSDNHNASKLLLQIEEETKANDISEKKIKQFLGKYLTSGGWDHKIAWGVNPAIDIEAERGKERWIIQVKGSGPFHPVTINHFLSVLGEIIQRMDDPKCKYSIALPDLEEFRRLWERLPELSRNRMGITALFVNLQGNVTEKS
jgi:hypothetical protein